MDAGQKTNMCANTKGRLPDEGPEFTQKETEKGKPTSSSAIQYFSILSFASYFREFTIRIYWLVS